MPYELNQVINMLKVYHQVETEAKNFLLFASFPMKNKDQKIKSALDTLKAIEEYKKLPEELRKELESDPESTVKNIIELEKLCLEAIQQL